MLETATGTVICSYRPPWRKATFAVRYCGVTRFCLRSKKTELLDSRV